MSQWSLSCKSMHLSIIFEMKLRLLTGLKLELISCNPNFLSRGHTMAVFHDLMNCPSVSDWLMILVISGRMAGRSCLKTVVGIGSNSQDLDLSDIITLCTSSSLSGVNFLILGESLHIGLYTGLLLSAS